MDIAYQGEPGAFGEQACHIFAPDAIAIGLPTFHDVFRAVDTGVASLGAVPAENSYAGSIPTVYDLIQQHRLRILADLLLPVEQVLMALPGSRLEDIDTVMSHPQALAQCDQFLHTHQWTLVSAPDTAGSARQVSQEHVFGTAVIASRTAAQRYRLEILADNIMTRHDNQTRFWLIGPPSVATLPGPRVTTTLLMILDDAPGALYGALKPFADAGVNLHKIESRPDTHPFSSRFILELEGDADEPSVAKALEAARLLTNRLTVFGSYPRVSVVLP